MRINRKKSFNKDNTDRWLLTYADMITLLLAFFIVMYSMSRLDAKKFGQISEELNFVLKGQKMTLVQLMEEQDSSGHGVMKIGNLNMIRQQIQQRFKEVDKQEIIQTEITERGLVVHIMESTLFKEGSSKLLPGALEVLDMIYERAKDVPNHLRIEGHTDDKPINTEQFHSNWELSTARATAVVDYFIESHNFPPAKISALGYGEYRPRVPNNSIENRAKNRRVDVVILTMELTMKEPSSQLYDIQN